MEVATKRSSISILHPNDLIHTLMFNDLFVYPRDSLIALVPK